MHLICLPVRAYHALGSIEQVSVEVLSVVMYISVLRLMHVIFQSHRILNVNTVLSTDIDVRLHECDMLVNCLLIKFSLCDDVIQQLIW